MTTRDALYHRLQRRETHSPRSAAAITVAALLMLIAAWIGTEGVLALLGAPALLASPSQILSALRGEIAIPTTALLAGGIGLALAGLVLVLQAVLPGARARHSLPSERCTIVVDDGIIATAITHKISLDVGLRREQLRLTLGRRTAELLVTPTVGHQIEADRFLAPLRGELDHHGLRLRPRVRLRQDGVIA